MSPGRTLVPAIPLRLAPCAPKRDPRERKRVHARLRRALPAGDSGEWASSEPIRTKHTFSWELAAAKDAGAAVTQIFLAFETLLSLHLEGGLRGCRYSARWIGRCGIDRGAGGADRSNRQSRDRQSELH